MSLPTTVLSEFLGWLATAAGIALVGGARQRLRARSPRGRRPKCWTIRSRAPRDT